MAGLKGAPILGGSWVYLGLKGAPILGGSWVVIRGVITRVTILVTLSKVLITPLKITHEPPSVVPVAPNYMLGSASGVWSPRKALPEEQSPSTQSPQSTRRFQKTGEPLSNPKP